MKPIASYPVWLFAFILLGPFLMASGAFFGNRRILVFPIAGASMVMIALFDFSKRLHEQMEEVASLRQLLNSRNDANRG